VPPLAFSHSLGPEFRAFPGYFETPLAGAFLADGTTQGNLWIEKKDISRKENPRMEKKEGRNWKTQVWVH
jgi:hypothetical protein